MGGGAKGGGQNWDQVAGTNAYNAAKGGQSIDMINANQPEYAAANQAGWDAWQSEQQQNAMFESMMSGFGGGESAPTGPSYEQQEADRIRREGDRIRREGESKRDGFISDYFTAANEATAFVTDKIAKEQANAAMMGVDYTMNDDLKAERIANYFSNLWSSESQSNLEKYTGEFGASGFTQNIFRGEGTESGPTKGKIGTEQNGTGGGTPNKSTLLTNDDENLLGSDIALGG